MCTAAEIAAFALLVVQVIAYGQYSQTVQWILTLFWVPVSALLVYLFAVEEGFLSGLLGRSKALRWIGDISGEAFLIHHICIKATEAIVKNKLAVSFIAFVLTIVCTVIWQKLYGIGSDWFMRRKAKG